jgi:hypothetical protein
LHVFKQSRATKNLFKVGEWRAHDVTGAPPELMLIQNWGAGMYQFRPEWDGMYFAPVSMLFRVGELEGGDEDVASRTNSEDTQGVIDGTIKQLGHVAVAQQLKTLTAPQAPPPQQTDTIALMQVMMAPLTAMLQATEARAARAEERLERVLDKMAEARNGEKAVQAPLFAEVFKSAVANPEVLNILMGNGSNVVDKPETWMDTMKDLVRELAPAFKGLVDGFVMKQVQAQLPQTTQPQSESVGSTAQPTRAESDKMSQEPPEPRSQPMPMPLSEEQVMAKDNLVAFIAEGDFDNAFAVLESFPGFVPYQGGMVPIGEFFLSRIDHKVHPRVYVPQLAMIIPEMKKVMDKAIPFIQHVQHRIASMAAQAEPDASEPKPTRESDE